METDRRVVLVVELASHAPAQPEELVDGLAARGLAVHVCDVALEDALPRLGHRC